LAKVKKLAKVATDLGTTLPRLGLAWGLKNPRVSSVITGASKPSQVKENMKAGELVAQLTDDVMNKIDTIL
jgi:aryl-alcohol dehydrogenase-like predicted oxidoreductase